MISLLSATNMPGKSALTKSTEPDQKELAADKRAVIETKHNSPSIQLSVPEVKPVIKTAEQKQGRHLNRGSMP